MVWDPGGRILEPRWKKRLYLQNTKPHAEIQIGPPKTSDTHLFI